MEKRLSLANLGHENTRRELPEQEGPSYSLGIIAKDVN